MLNAIIRKISPCACACEVRYFSGAAVLYMPGCYYIVRLSACSCIVLRFCALFQFQVLQQVQSKCVTRHRWRVSAIPCTAEVPAAHPPFLSISFTGRTSAFVFTSPLVALGPVVEVFIFGPDFVLFLFFFLGPPCCCHCPFTLVFPCFPCAPVPLLSTGVGGTGSTALPLPMGTSPFTFGSTIPLSDPCRK
jgi:hypothetical protein